MKRNAVNDRLPYVFSHYSLIFWYKCRCCQQEFRREHGWRIVNYPIINGTYSETYMCESCAKSSDDVRNYITKQEQELIDYMRKNSPRGGTAVSK